MRFALFLGNCGVAAVHVFAEVGSFSDVVAGRETRGISGARDQIGGGREDEKDKDDVRVLYREADLTRLRVIDVATKKAHQVTRGACGSGRLRRRTGSGYFDADADLA
jgi:hypothetical protein